MFGVKSNSPDMTSVSPTLTESGSDCDSTRLSPLTPGSTSPRDVSPPAEKEVMALVNVSPTPNESGSDSGFLNVSSLVSTPPPSTAATIVPVVIRPIPLRAPARVATTVTTSPQSVANAHSANGSPVSATGSPVADHKTISASGMHMFFHSIVDDAKSLLVDTSVLQLRDDIKMCELLIAKDYTYDEGILTHFSTDEINSFLVKYKSELAIGDTEQKQLNNNLNSLNAIGQQFRNSEKEFGFEWFKKFHADAIAAHELLMQYHEELALLEDEKSSLGATASDSFMKLLNDKREQIAQLTTQMQKRFPVRDRYFGNIDGREFLALQEIRDTNVQQFRAEINKHMKQLEMLYASLTQPVAAASVESDSDNEDGDWAPESAPGQGLKGVSVDFRSAYKYL